MLHLQFVLSLYCANPVFDYSYIDDFFVFPLLSCRLNFVKLIDELDAGALSWEEFSSQVKRLHADRLGAPYLRRAGETPKEEENFYANPLPGCVCNRSKAKLDSKHLKQRRKQRAASRK